MKVSRQTPSLNEPVKSSYLFQAHDDRRDTGYIFPLKRGEIGKYKRQPNFSKNTLSFKALKSSTLYIFAAMGGTQELGQPYLYGCFMAGHRSHGYSFRLTLHSACNFPWQTLHTVSSYTYLEFLLQPHTPDFSVDLPIQNSLQEP